MFECVRFSSKTLFGCDISEDGEHVSLLKWYFASICQKLCICVIFKRVFCDCEEDFTRIIAIKCALNAVRCASC